MNAERPCPHEDLTVAERRERLAAPSGAAHGAECGDCARFLAIDAHLALVAALAPPPPPQARWAHVRARWIVRNEASEQAALYGDLVAKLLGAFGAIGALGLVARALRAPGDGAAPTLLFAVVGAAVVAAALLVAAYREASET